MADSKKYDGSQWEHSLRKLTTATEAVENPLYSDGTAITSYTIKGNTVQNGTPTPSNPVEVNGVGERTAQLWDINSWDDATAQRGTLERVTNGYKLTATSNDAYTITYGSGAYSYSVTGGSEYTISWTVDNPQIYGVVYIFTGTSVADTPLTTAVASSGSKTFTVPSGHNYVAFRLGVSSIGDEITYTNIMLNTGSAPLPYEPYGYIIPISSGGVTTNIYLGSTQTVRPIKKIVFDGSENWQGADNSASKYLADIVDYKVESGIICMSTHYSGANNIVSGDSIPNNSACFYNAAYPRYFYLKGSEPITLADFKAYLAAQYANGTPVTVWYVLANPETAAVNEPLMKIGTYADTLSNAASIPTTEGANSITVDTTVQPSEFTATWTGWHDASVKEKSENFLDENDFGLVEVAAETYRVGTDVGVLPSGKYTFNAVKSSSAVQIYRTTKNGSTYNYETITNLPYTFTADGVSNQIFRSAGNTGSSWAGLGYSDIMLSTGETAQTYEPYWQ